MEFDLPLSQPYRIEDHDLEISVYDPVYYYAYTIMEPVHLVDAPAGCEVQISRFDEDDETAEIRRKLAALSREEMPSDPNIGALFSETVALTCS